MKRIFGVVVTYLLLLVITKYAFHRIVTSELLLIVVWTMLEAAVVNWLNAGGYLTGFRLVVMVIVLILAFVISTILYVAYYECLLCGNGSAGDRGCGDDHVGRAFGNKI